jgi:hypothetical protein
MDISPGWIQFMVRLGFFIFWSKLSRFPGLRNSRPAIFLGVQKEVIKRLRASLPEWQ